jgi:hypothetical protein
MKDEPLQKNQERWSSSVYVHGMIQYNYIGYSHSTLLFLLN